MCPAGLAPLRSSAGGSAGPGPRRARGHPPPRAALRPRDPRPSLFWSPQVCGTFTFSCGPPRRVGVVLRAAPGWAAPGAPSALLSARSGEWGSERTQPGSCGAPLARSRCRCGGGRTRPAPSTYRKRPRSESTGPAGPPPWQERSRPSVDAARSCRPDGLLHHQSSGSCRTPQMSLLSG